MRFDIYTGKQHSLASEESGDQCATHKVVIKLMKDLTGKLHKVYMDNFYSAPALFLDLLENSLYARGTKIQPRKHFPKLKKAKEKLPETNRLSVSKTNDITATPWHNQKIPE